MKPWPEIFQEQEERYSSCVGWLADWWAYNLPFVHFIERVHPKPYLDHQTSPRVLEIGTGTGAIGALLAARGYTVSVSDNNPECLKRAISLFDTLELEPPLVHLLDICAPIPATTMHFQMPQKYDIVFSAGLLEHFTDFELFLALTNMRKLGNCVIAEVPTRWALKNDPALHEVRTSFLTMPDLTYLFKESGFNTIQTFAWGNPNEYRWLQLLLPHGVWRAIQQQGWLACSLAIAGWS